MEKENIYGNEKSGNLIVLLLAVVLCWIQYSVVINELPYYLSDYNGHLYVYLPAFTESFLEGWVTTPYCLWHLTVLFQNVFLHIPLEAGAGFATCLFEMIIYFTLVWMQQKVTAAAGAKDMPARSGLIAFGLCMVEPLYCYWLNTGDRFLGTYSMNPLHNPTQMCVRGFGLLAFCLTYDIMRHQNDVNYRGIFFPVENGLKRYYIELAIILLISTLAKPTFAEMFIPAAGVLMLAEWIRRIRQRDGSGKAYFRYCLNMMVCALPSLGYILLSYVAYFVIGRGSGSSVIITDWLEVWHMYSDNVILSVLLGMAFPLLMIVLDASFFIIRDGLGKLALTGYVIGFAEAALLGESGDRLGHGNFIWPMMSGMLLLWTAAVMRLLVMERKRDENTRKGRIVVNLAWGLFFLHVLCGLMYVRSMLIE